VANSAAAIHSCTYSQANVGVEHKQGSDAEVAGKQKVALWVIFIDRVIHLNKDQHQPFMSNPFASIDNKAEVFVV